MQAILRRKCESGSVLLTSLVLAMILGLTLSGYLYWVRTQNVLVAQSQAWNTALAHAEAGVEEALAQVNVNFGTNYIHSAMTNWGGSLYGRYFGPRAGNFTNGSYSVIIRPMDDPLGPVIISTGYAAVPYLGKTVTRTVEVRTKCSAAFGLAIAAMQNVQMNGNFVMVDSFDSFDPAHSTNGLYDASTRKAGGDVASVYGFIDVANAEIYGHVRTAPFGNATAGSQGQVGDLNWNGPGIQNGWYIPDYNATYPNVTPPFTTGSFSMPSATNGVVTLYEGDYLVEGDYTIPNNTTVEVVGNARVWIQGNFRMVSPSGSFLNITAGGTLKMYVGTETGPAVASDFTLVNNAGNAYNFQYYGLPSNTAVSWGGNDAYIGTVYAPQAVFTLNGSGNNTYSDYQGACVVRSVSMNGHFNFHYDENLGRRGPVSGFVAYRWRELPPPAAMAAATTVPTASAMP